MEFSSAIQNVMSKFLKCNPSICLKPKQLESLKIIWNRNCDLIVNLPVGYGKSLIFYMLPDLLKLKYNTTSSMIIVVAPLNITQQDHLKEVGIAACRLDIKGRVIIEGDESDSDGEDILEASLGANIEDIISGKYEIVYCHPEALLHTKYGKKILSSPKVQELVRALVVDECHIVESW